MSPRQNLVGQRFGRLVVERFAFVKEDKAYWHCRCDCGGERITRAALLKRGGSSSCGCKVTELAIANGHKSRRHGHAGPRPSREYSSWNAILNRCRNPKATAYERYGGCGIKICDRWLCFENFLADMGPRPKGKSIDRYPNPYGDYEPSNCRWATPLEQRHNQRK